MLNFKAAYKAKSNSSLYPCLAISSVVCATSSFGQDLISEELFVKYGGYVLAISFVTFLVYSLGAVIGEMIEKHLSQKCGVAIIAVPIKAAMCVGFVAAITFVVNHFSR